LSRAAHEDSVGPDVRKLLEVSQSAAALNPFEHGLHESDKIQRVLRAFQIASARLDACAKASAPTGSVPPSLAALAEQLKQWKPNANNRFLARQPDQIDALFDFSTSVEKQLQSSCGTPAPEDSALLALANSHATDEK
jgi:hypothetical protein